MHLAISILADRRDAMPCDPHLSRSPPSRTARAMRTGVLSQLSLWLHPCGHGAGLWVRGPVSPSGSPRADLAGNRMNWARTPQGAGSGGSSLVSVRQQEIGFWCPDSSLFQEWAVEKAPATELEESSTSASPMASLHQQPGPTRQGR